MTSPSIRSVLDRFSVAVNRRRGLFCQTRSHGTDGIPGRKKEWVPVTFTLPYPVWPSATASGRLLHTAAEVIRHQFADLREVQFSTRAARRIDPTRLP